jgi:hypothetical protein
MPLSPPSVRRTSRKAGIIQLIFLATAVFCFAYLPAALHLGGAPAEQVSALLEAPLLYRLGVVANLLCSTASFILPLMLFRLLGAHGKLAGIVMVALAALSLPGSFMNIFRQFEILALLHEVRQATALSASGLDMHIADLLDSYAGGVMLTMTCWSLWMLPFGYLVIRSGLLPKLLGWLLIVGGAVGLAEAGTGTLAQAFGLDSAATCVLAAAMLGQVATCLWMLILGAKELAAAPVATFTPFASVR